MKPTENLSRQIQSMVILSKHWRDTMPRKPRKKGAGMEWREWEGLKVALEKFEEFGTGYEIILNKAPIPIQHFIINKGVENLVQGFSVISRACEQRRGTITTNSLGYFLAQAEDILEGYCAQWRGNEYGSPYLNLISPVAYFEKIFGIARSLYAPEIPIVSIPLTMYNHPELWLALAHEIGHHIYWNSLDSYEETDEFQFSLSMTIGKTNPAKIWEGWVEEIFADICGTLLAGPAYVISCQNTAAERARQPADLAKNDGEHPAGYLRPLISLQVMREIEKGENSDVINSIENRWRVYTKGVEFEKCQPTHTNSRFSLPNKSATDLTLGELASDIAPIVQAILNEAMWPGRHTLLNLIQPYSKKEIEIPDLDDLVLVEQSNRKTLIEQRPSVTGPDIREMTETVKKLWQFLRGRLSVSEPSVLEEWEKFLDLGLDETHGHWLAGAHDDCRTHVIYALHRHDQGGSGNVINC